MLRTISFHLLVTATVCFGQASGTASKRDPWIGVWKLDAAKSKFGAFTPHRDQLLRLQVAGDSLQYDIYTVYADGKVGSLSFALPPDGQEHSMPDGSKLTIRRVGNDTLGVIARRGDKTVQNYKLEVSPDRETITLVSETDRRVFRRRPDDSFPQDTKSPSK